ncbi:MAG: hypothetical protein JW702_09100 [Clostridiales bacterium]|nr:hypothetical protein [Clostridiales bacterium]
MNFVQLPDKMMTTGNGPWTSAWVHINTGESWHILGWDQRVKKYIEKVINSNYENYIVHFTEFSKHYTGDPRKRASSNYWHVRISNPIGLLIEINPPFDKKRKFVFNVVISGISYPLLSLRKIPKKWIPEYDAVIKQATALIDSWS